MLSKHTRTLICPTFIRLQSWKKCNIVLLKAFFYPYLGSAVKSKPIESTCKRRVHKKRNKEKEEKTGFCIFLYVRSLSVVSTSYYNRDCSLSI